MIYVKASNIRATLTSRTHSLLNKLFLRLMETWQMHVVAGCGAAGYASNTIAPLVIEELLC